MCTEEKCSSTVKVLSSFDKQLALMWALNTGRLLDCCVGFPGWKTGVWVSVVFFLIPLDLRNDIQPHLLANCCPLPSSEIVLKNSQTKTRVSCIFCFGKGQKYMDSTFSQLLWEEWTHSHSCFSFFPQDVQPSAPLKHGWIQHTANSTPASPRVLPAVREGSSCTSQPYSNRSRPWKIKFYNSHWQELIQDSFCF